MQSRISRRRFLELGACAAAGTALGTGLGSFKPAASRASSEAEQGPSGKREQIPTTCAMCVNKCGVVADVVNGELKKLNPNPEYIKSRGMLCAKGNAGAAIPYSPDRLKKPLLRTGERGEGKWKEISWEEAYKKLAGNLAELK